MTQEAAPALPNRNDEEAARDEKGPEIFILSLAQDASAANRSLWWFVVRGIGRRAARLTHFGYKAVDVADERRNLAYAVAASRLIGS